jgi:hypothetical protein
MTEQITYKYVDTVHRKTFTVKYHLLNIQHHTVLPRFTIQYEKFKITDNGTYFDSLLLLRVGKYLKNH